MIYRDNESEETRMKVVTKHFGEVEVDDSKVVTFDNGIFGLEDQKQFIFFYEGDENPNGLCWMQSLNDSQLALPVVSPIFWFPDYSPEISDEEVGSIGELKEEDLQIFSVVVMRESIEDMTCNLQAPILVNYQTQKGIQVIVQGDIYKIRHNFYEQMQKMKAGD